MYSPKTIASYLKKMAAAIMECIQMLASLHVCITKGNRKIGRVLNVSLPPITSCGGACRVCKGLCYDIKACMQYGNVLLARARNYALAMYDRDRYFAEIEKALSPRRRRKAFRWHVGGDILDYDYLCHMIDIARRHPDWVFWTYTKQYALVNRYVAEHGGSIAAAMPENLSIMFSVWDGLRLDNPYCFATFECVLDGHAWPENVMLCPGNCEYCLEHGIGCPHRCKAAVKQH